MAVHKLILDDIYEEVDCTLIAIHTTIESYRLAYLLNKYLSINLARMHSDLDVSSNNARYSIYEWEDTKQHAIWSLVSNTCKIEISKQNKLISLFETEKNVTRISYLVPEYKVVNFFLKIDNQLNLIKEKNIIKTILGIQHIATAYSVDINQLKSKDNLIFR